MRKLIAEAFKAITESNHVIALTGAGISTLSGIPDFRSPNIGLWNRFDQEKIFQIDYFHQDPQYFYEFAREFIYQFTDSKPNIIHNILANMQRKKILKSLITQNIDMLHQKAGSTGVLELHGSPEKSFCLDCGEFFSIEQMQKKLSLEKIPHCDKCNGLIKPDIIFFGEMLHEDTLNKAFMTAEKSDCCIVLGTSLVVHPAASIPQIVLRNGGRLIIVNRDKTSTYIINSLRCGLSSFWRFHQWKFYILQRFSPRQPQSFSVWACFL